MGLYRLHCRKDGQIIDSRLIEADRDADAVDRLPRPEKGFRYELWQGARLVAFLAGEETKDPA